MKRAFILLLALLLCCCAAPAATQPPAEASSSSAEAAPEAPPPPPEAAAAGEEERYSVFLNEKSYYFNRAGELIPGGDSESLIYDDIHTRPVYIVKTRDEDTGEDDEWGNPVVQRYSALYSPEGELLHDWEPICYNYGCGSLLIRNSYNPFFMFMDPTMLGDDYQSELWNPATGETVIDGVGSVTRIEDNAYIVLDVTGKALGVIDRSGNIISGFPFPGDYYYPSVSGGYILADSHNPYEPMPAGKQRQYTLMDKDLNVLYTGEDINIGYYRLRGDFMLAGQGETRNVLSLERIGQPDFEQPLFSYNNETEYLEYFDGELAILRTGDRDNWKYTLMRVGDEPEAISEPYDQIVIEDHYTENEPPAEYFLARNGEEALLLDRDGNIKKRGHVPGAVGFEIMRDGYYFYRVDGDTDEYGYTQELVGTLDADFNIVIPAEKYLSLYQAASYNAGSSENYDLLIGYDYSGKLSRSDLLRLDGSTIVTGLSQVGTFGQNRVAVIRGFSMGLMDWDGQWISKYSVYDGFKVND